MSNSDNPKNGAIFQRQVCDWFQAEFHKEFELEKKLLIGDPAKEHKFDIVDRDNTVAVECKRYTWTETGNVPSAKMGFTNEAAFYLSFLPDSYDKFIVMLYSWHEKRKETLAEYYYRTNRHLLGGIKVAEFDPEKNQMRIISGDTTDPGQNSDHTQKPMERGSVFQGKNVKQAILLLQERKVDIARYCDLQKRSSEVNIAEDKEFQKAFTAFYRLRRDDAWRDYYFKLFEEQKHKKTGTSFGEIQLRLFQHCGQIESSFSSKMLATIKPEMPIWDSYVLKNLGLKLKGTNKDIRFSLAVVLYDNICSWYRDFMKTDEAKEMGSLFDQTFPEFNAITPIKKIDFIIWALR